MNGVTIFEKAEQLALGKLESGGPIATDADAENPGAAAFALGLKDGVEDDLSTAVEISIGFEFLVGERVLSPHIFASAPFEHEADLDMVGAMLMEVHGRRAGADVGTVVGTVDGIDGVLAEVTPFGGFGDGEAGGFFEVDLVESDWGIDVEQDATCVLADGLGFLFGELDILLDDFHRGLGDATGFFTFEGREDGALNIVGDFGGRPADNFDQRIQEHIHVWATVRLGFSGVNELRAWGDGRGNPGWIAPEA